MKIYIKPLLISIICWTLIGCQDKLDFDPQQGFSAENAFDTPEKISNILTGAYAQAGQTSSYGGQIYTIAELLGNNDELSWNGTFTELGEFNLKTVSAENTFVEQFWLNSYNISNQTNIVLSFLDVFEDQTQKNSVEGQAKFLRAVAYFDLIRFFAKPNNNRVNDGELGVPIVEDPVIALEDVTYPSRNTVGEVYNFIIQDLEDAINLLPEFNGTLASANAARALLARIHLQIGNLEPARDLSNEVIESGFYRLTNTITEAYNNEENSTEDIFAWQVTDNDGANSLVTFWAADRFGGRPGNPDIGIENSFFQIFDDINDARLNFFYIDSETGSGIATQKWLRGNANIPFLRLAEMYLIRAEANGLLGTAIGDAPFNDIDRIRFRAGAATLTQFTLNSIFLERLKELAFEGHRIHDFKRFEVPIGTLTFDDNSLILPIPQREINTNPNLEPND